MTDLDYLEKLAKAAKESQRVLDWYTNMDTDTVPEWDRHRVVLDAFNCMASPAVILALVAVAERARLACQLLRITELSPSTAERCEALDEALTALDTP